ncbi:MAG: hypothetical protein KDA77_24025 [Planctomycetaceae bacterium]|nr:hypothetical protein [Planctomycetaceae bacterium]
MDPVKKIEMLEAKRDALEQQLAAPGIDKDERHDINQRIIAVSNEITAYASKLPQLPPPPDSRTRWERLCDDLDGKIADPIFLHCSIVSMSVGLWFIMRNYMFLRHHRGAYTAEQANWRRTVFLIHLPHVPGAARIGAGAGLLAVIRAWTLPPPPGWPPGKKLYRAKNENSPDPSPSANSSWWRFWGSSNDE